MNFESSTRCEHSRVFTPLISHSELVASQNFSAILSVIQSVAIFCRPNSKFPRKIRHVSKNSGRFSCSNWIDLSLNFETH